MKEKELKSSLSCVKSTYVISGADRFLCFRALETLKAVLCPNFPDLNIVYVSGDRVEIPALVDDLQVCPFGDNYRLVIVKDFKTKKNASKAMQEQFKLLEDYAKLEQFTSVLVFFNAGEEGVLSIKNAEVVDCSKLSDLEVAEFIDKKLSTTKVSISNSAKAKLIRFALNDLSRISSELDKLVAFESEGEITEELVENFVAKDIEYQIFELAELIAKGQNEQVVAMLRNMLLKEKTLFSIISPLYNTYKRALFIAINKEMTDKDLASLLQIKEYAVKMLRVQTRVFSPKKLKIIVDDLADLDKNIKQGKIKDDVGLISVVINILMLRK